MSSISINGIAHNIIYCGRFQVVVENPRNGAQVSFTHKQFAALSNGVGQ